MTEINETTYQQSAVVPYRQTAKGIEILLITNRSGKRWIVPKGLVEPDMTPAESAANEAYEEAGAQGQVHGTPLGTYTYAKWGGTCVVEVFAMRVEILLDEWLEDHFRLRKWVSLKEALAHIQEDKLRTIIQTLPTVIHEGN